MGQFLSESHRRLTPPNAHKNGGILMKRMLAVLFSLVLTVSLLSGCNLSQNGEGPPTVSGSIFLTESNTEKTTDSGHTTDRTDKKTETVSTDATQGGSTDIVDPPNDETPLYQYDKYKISADGEEYLSDREYQLYCHMIDSILSYDGIIEGFASYEEFDKMINFFFSEFIPAHGILQTLYHSDTPFSYENGTATLKFVGDRETCAQNYAVFEEIINEALALIKEDDSEWERIAKLYLFVSDHMDYGNPYDVLGINAHMYTEIIYELGVCGSYARYLCFLADQAGFETIRAVSLEKNGYGWADHAWSMIRVEGKWYHFDACWQPTSLPRESLQWFAFDTEKRSFSLAHNNSQGIVGDVEMFYQRAYPPYRRTELPTCTEGLSEGERIRLYQSIIDEYNAGISYDIKEPLIDAYIDRVFAPFETSNIPEICVVFRPKPGTGNLQLKEFLRLISPRDYENYESLPDNEICTEQLVYLKHADQTRLKEIMRMVILSGIALQKTVTLIA